MDKEDFQKKSPSPDIKDGSSEPKADGAPEKPTEKGEYKFNLGFWRIETLNDILIACAQKYMKAIRKRDEKSIYEYQAIVNTLFTETYIYMEEETEIEEENVPMDKQTLLESRLDERKSFSNDEEAMQHLKQVREVYLGVRQLMQSVGLDIPKKETVKDIDVFNQT